LYCDFNLKNLLQLDLVNQIFSPPY